MVRYESRDYRFNRQFYPERNNTMSALTEATVIVEPGETSGTLIEARKLFILESCFQNPALTWTAKDERKGAIRARSHEDIRDVFSP